MKAIIFDFDGVIIRSMEDQLLGWQLALAQYGIEMPPEELYILEGVGFEDIASRFTRKYNLPYDEAPRILERKQLHYDQPKSFEHYPHLIEVLDWIRDKGIRAGVVSGGTMLRVTETLESFGLTDYFDSIVTAEDTMTWKPSPEPYLLIAHTIGVSPEDCFVIENAPLGVRSAKLADMKCLGLTSTLAPMFLKQADIVADNLKEALDALQRMY